jgi:hypothetical protein
LADVKFVLEHFKNVVELLSGQTFCCIFVACTCNHIMDESIVLAWKVVYG